MRKMDAATVIAVASLLLPGAACGSKSTEPAPVGGSGQYNVVDTGQSTCYDDAVAIPAPDTGAAFHGQDAQYAGSQPNYTLSGDGLTVYDAVTGLTWTHAADTDGNGTVNSDDKLTWTEFQNYAASLNAESYGGYSDWRLPTIKELYSLIVFTGIDPSGYTGDVSGLVPFIDTNYFDFAYGDESAGERIIDAQYWSNTQYVGTVFDGQPAVFGVNFADGRIKGYPRDIGMNGTRRQFALCVRGNPDYGRNSFVDNGDGTITDLTTGLVWMQGDNGTGVTWEDALAYAESLVFAGYDDWRLPNSKELQSIVDYTRSPSTTGSAAIDPVFSCTQITNEAGEPDYGYYWSGTTHANWTAQSGAFGAYVAFGRGLGYFGPPGMESWIDVHGAGCQRSDPKSGDPASYPTGHGPQGDAIRIYNYVRAVRDANATTGGPGDRGSVEPGLKIRSAPNPFRASTVLRFEVPSDGADLQLSVFDAQGRRVERLAQGFVSGGVREVAWPAPDGSGWALPAGVYFARLAIGDRVETVRMVRVR
jgi:hypothetical protein